MPPKAAKRLSSGERWVPSVCSPLCCVSATHGFVFVPGVTFGSAMREVGAAKGELPPWLSASCRAEVAPYVTY